MKNIKDIIIGVFAVIGFAAIVTGFTNEAIQSNKIDVENKSTVDYKVCIYCIVPNFIHVFRTCSYFEHGTS